MAVWSSVISSIAFGIALAVAAYAWQRMRVVSIGVVAWCAAAWALSLWGFFHDARGWQPADVPGFFLFGIADFLIAVSMVSLSFIGILALHPDPVRIGLHPLALISLFAMPLSIAVHLLALRRLMSPGLSRRT